MNKKLPLCCPCARLPSLCRGQPQIMEYIQVKHEVQELSKQVGEWQRKVEIAEAEASRVGAGASPKGALARSGSRRSPTSPGLRKAAGGGSSIKAAGSLSPMAAGVGSLAALGGGAW